MIDENDQGEMSSFAFSPLLFLSYHDQSIDNECIPISDFSKSHRRRFFLLVNI